MNAKVVSILALCIGLFFAYSNYSSDARYSRIDKSGLLAEAITPDQYTERTRKGIKTYSLQLKFTTQEGREISAGSHNVSKATIDKFEAGEPVMVKYLADNPSEAIFVGDSASGSVWYVWLVAFGGIAYGLYGLFVNPNEDVTEYYDNDDDDYDDDSDDE